MIQFFAVNHQHLVLINEEDIFANPDQARWINVESPSQEDINELMTLYQIPKYFFTSVLDDHEPSRVANLSSNNDEASMLLLSYPKHQTSPLGYLNYATYPINFIVIHHIIITISDHPAPFIQRFVMRQEVSSQIIPDQKWLLTQMLWYIAHDYVTSLNDISHQMEILEKQLTSATQNEQIYQIMALQKTLIEFESALTQNRPVLKALRSANFLISDHTSKLNNAAIIENEQALSMCHIQSQILDQYSNMVSAVVSNNLNAVMKILTSITLILTIPTIIGGLYGMNVALPGAHLASAFSLILFVTIIISAVTLVLLKRHNYM